MAETGPQRSDLGLGIVALFRAVTTELLDTRVKESFPGDQDGADSAPLAFEAIARSNAKNTEEPSAGGPGCSSLIASRELSAGWASDLPDERFASGGVQRQFGQELVAGRIPAASWNYARTEQVDEIMRRLDERAEEG